MSLECSVCYNEINPAMYANCHRPLPAETDPLHEYCLADLFQWIGTGRSSCPLCNRNIYPLFINEDGRESTIRDQANARHRGALWAARNNRLDILQNYLQLGMDPHTRGEALAFAARKGHLDIVNALLASGPIDNWSRRNAITDAAEEGFFSVVSVLINDIDPLNRDFLDSYCVVLCCAVKKEESLQLVDRLLPLMHQHENNPENSLKIRHSRGVALTNALESNHPEYCSLLANGQMLPADTIAAFQLAICKYHSLEMVNTLLERHKDPEIRAMMMAIAAGFDHPDIVEALKADPISLEERGGAVSSLLVYFRKFSKSLLPILLSQGPITSEKRDATIAEAQQEGMEDLIPILQGASIQD